MIKIKSVGIGFTKEVLEILERFYVKELRFNDPWISCFGFLDKGIAMPSTESETFFFLAAHQGAGFLGTVCRVKPIV